MTENENNMTAHDENLVSKDVPAYGVFDLLTAHAEEYQNVITVTKVQKDIESTFGVRLSRNAIVARLRAVAAKGLITRDNAKGRGWYVYSNYVPTAAEVVTDRSSKHNTTKPVKKARSLLKVENGNKKVKNREFSESVKTFIQASRKKGRNLVFTTDAVLSFLRLNDMAVPPRERIVKAISNMMAQKRGVVKTDRPAVYCVLAEETRFDQPPTRLMRAAMVQAAEKINKSAVRRPDVVTPKNARQTATPPATEIQQVSQAVLAIAAAFRAVSRLSGLIGNFKE